MRAPTAAIALCLALAPAATGGEVERGRYLTQIMDCGGCHTPGSLVGKPDMNRYVGCADIGFEIPGLGYFYPSNLTPDPETGLGKWTDEEIVTALRTGVRPDGRELAGIMPWRSYAAITDEDASALVAFLRSLPPVSWQRIGPFGADEKPTAPYMSVIAPR